MKNGHKTNQKWFVVQKGTSKFKLFNAWDGKIKLKIIIHQGIKIPKSFDKRLGNDVEQCDWFIPVLPLVEMLDWRVNFLCTKEGNEWEIRQKRKPTEGHNICMQINSKMFLGWNQLDILAITFLCRSILKMFCGRNQLDIEPIIFLSHFVLKL